MTIDPIPPPPMMPPVPQAPRVDVSKKVNAPGIALMVTACIGFLLQLRNLLFPVDPGDILSMMEQFSPDVDVEQYSDLINMATSGNIVFTLVGLALTVLVFMGGLKMRNLQNWGLCLAASILALVPCTSPCCCLGIPIGIWALIVLMDSAVKDAFESNKTR